MSGKGLFINDVIIFGGYRAPPPLVIIRHFLAPPPLTAHVTRDKTAYVGLLTTFKGPSQPGTASPATLNVSILSFSYLQFYSEGRDDLKLG